MLDLAALILACAPHVHPTTMHKLIDVESGGHPYIINIVGEGPQNFNDAATAIAKTREAVAKGNNVAMGLMQVTTKTAKLLGVTIDDMFEPCANLRAGAQVLTENYTSASKQLGEGQAALQAALSAYNTGNFSAGFSNGYVAQFYGGGADTHQDHAALRVRVTPSPYTASPVVFTRQKKQSEPDTTSAPASAASVAKP